MFLFFGIFEERVNSFLFVLLLAVSIWSLRAVIHPKFHSFERLLMFNAIGLIFINLILNASFYPQLAEFQAGYTTAKELKASPYAKSPIYKLTAKHSWALDFYHRFCDCCSSFDVARRHKALGKHLAIHHFALTNAPFPSLAHRFFNPTDPKKQLH